MRSPAELAEHLPALAGLSVRGLLADGPLSRKWLVDLEGAACVLRADKPAAALLGLDREGEAESLSALAAAGWSPPPLYCLPEEGILLTPFVEGRAWSPADYADPARLERLGALLARLHAAEVPVRDFALAQRVSRYAAIIDNDMARSSAEELRSLLAEADAAQCLCHNDPTGGNVIGDADPTLIDWEFAAIGAPGFDLAAVIEAQRLPARGVRALLRGYKATDGAVQPDLSVWRRVYRLTETLWREALEAAGRDEGPAGG